MPATSTIRKELTQCQYCAKSQGPGVSLKKCAGCEIDLYCSRECQRSAWKLHKAKCALNQRYKNTPIEQDTLKNLRSFTSKHRPTIAEAGVRLLDVFADPSRAERDVLLISLTPRSGSTRVETSFVVTAVNVVPIDSFASAQEMRGQLKQASDSNKRTGMAGAFFALLMDTTSGKSNVAPVGFPKAAEGSSPRRGVNYGEWLTKQLNDGTIF